MAVIHVEKNGTEGDLKNGGEKCGDKLYSHPIVLLKFILWKYYVPSIY